MQTTNLNLPDINSSTQQQRRALSAGGFCDEGFFLSTNDFNISGSNVEMATTSSSQTSVGKDKKKEFEVKIIKMYTFDRAAKDQEKKEKEEKEEKER